MQRRAMALLGLVVIAALVFMILKTGRPNKPATPAPAVMNTSAAAKAEQPKNNGETPQGTPEPEKPLTDLDRVLNGETVPPLPASAPSQVRFGVILFMYQGAEGAPANAPPKDVAYKHALSVLPEALADFAEAAKKGDPGSLADAGKVPRDVLDPALEYVLFTLEPGKVFHEPLNTPRGFWLLQRIQ